MVMGGAGTGRGAVGEGEVAELLLVEHLQGPRRVAGTGRGAGVGHYIEGVHTLIQHPVPGAAQMIAKEGACKKNTTMCGGCCL